MSQTVFGKHIRMQLAALDHSIAALNRQKAKLLLKELLSSHSEEDLERILDWPTIVVTVRDRQMRVQLNGLCKSVPNLRFIVRHDLELFTVTGGEAIYT
jgi:hypothetical protein